MRSTIASIVHAPEDEEFFHEATGLREPEIFLRLEENLSSQEGTRKIAAAAKRSFTEPALHRGWSVSDSFRPTRTWFCFGVELVYQAYPLFKFSKYGDEPADKRKPANPFLDLYYIMYCAITDGLLSKDENQLKLAWACWPEKRDNIRWFDDKTKTHHKYVPSWQG